MAENWSLSQEEEDQGLFRKARKGDEKAKQELQDVYGVRLWSEQERATLVYKLLKMVRNLKKVMREKPDLRECEFAKDLQVLGNGMNVCRVRH